MLIAGRRAPPHDCSTRPWPRPAGCRRRTRTSRTSRSGPRSAAGSGTRSWRASPTRRWLPPTTARSSCGSSPTSRVTSTSPTRSPARRTSIARRPPACCTRSPADVTSDERSMAKMVNFGLAYGMSDFGLSSRAGSARQDAQEFINSYFAAYGGISYYMHHIRETAREQGYRRHAPRAASDGSRSWRRATRRCGPPASGWRSTCPSRARPPTSSRSR